MTGQETDADKAAAVLAAFNVNPPKGWAARLAGSRNVTLIHFLPSTSMVTFIYHVAEDKFSVKFTKFQGAFGDFMLSISRGLHVILTTLQSGGLDVAAPPSPDNVRVECVLDNSKNVFCRYAPDEEWPPVLGNVVQALDYVPMEQLVPDDPSSYVTAEPEETPDVWVLGTTETPDDSTWEACVNCDGSGLYKDMPCEVCEGTGAHDPAED